MAEAPHEFACRISDSWAVYVATSDKLFVLNSTAKTAWDLLACGHDVDSVAGIFAERFGITCEQAACDIHPLVAMQARSARHSSSENPAAATEACAPVAAVNCSTRGETVDHGVFRFGPSRIRFLTSASTIDRGYFHRFVHRLVSPSSGEHLLEVAEAGSSCRLILDGTVVDEVAVPAATTCLVDFLLDWEHPGQPLMARCHAAAVSREGKSILMPGGSGVGKSTLTAYLVANGMAYLGDDVVALGEDDASLFPLPSCLSIKTGSWQLLERYYPGLMQRPSYRVFARDVRYLEPLGNYRTSPNGGPPAAIVFPVFVSGAAVHLEALSPVAALVRFVGAHTSLVGAVTEDKLAKLIRFVERTPAYELRYSQLPEAQRVITSLLATDEGAASSLSADIVASLGASAAGRRGSC